MFNRLRFMLILFFYYKAIDQWTLVSSLQILYWYYPKCSYGYQKWQMAKAVAKFYTAVAKVLPPPGE